MMLVGYVSDERYVVLPDVQVEFDNGEIQQEVRSTASGAVRADIPPGEYRVTLAYPGYGFKRLMLEVGSGKPYHFRMLKDQLLGYAWPKCVQSGEASEFRVHSHEPYKLDLWRYGIEKTHVRTIGWFDEHGPRATVQITPDGDYSQAGVQWNQAGYTHPHHKQYVTAPARSGLYYFHAKTESGLFFSFPWVVAPVQPTAPVAVLMADITWNAYNNFGGRSNYIHASKLPDVPTANARLELHRYTNPEHESWGFEDYDPLSFDRPEPINHIPEDEQIDGPIEGRAACHVAPTEWRLLGWLEREGFHADVYSETQLHSDTLNLDDYRVLIISTHPEYWSRKMYHQVKEWVFKRGGRLIYLGGNGLNCEVEFTDEHTCIYQNGDARVINEPGSGYESRFNLRNESEACLLGVVFDYRGIMTAAPYEVKDPNHWVFDGTSLEAGELFGELCQHQRIPGGASGHETDKISASSPSNTQLLAEGKNPDGGGAQMVLHEPMPGAAVFSVGSICWPSSLLVDDAVSRITANVVRRFVQAEGSISDDP